MTPFTTLLLTVTVVVQIIRTATHILFAACALRPDLALLANGDMTEVGEKGITVRNGFKTDDKWLT